MAVNRSLAAHDEDSSSAKSLVQPQCHGGRQFGSRQDSCTRSNHGGGVPGKDALIRRWLVRGGLAAALVVGIVISYRTIFVYQLLPRPCPAPERRPMSAEHLPPGMELTVLSYNIEGHAALVRSGHLAQIARLIVERGADVVALQEVHRGTWQARFRDQAAELGRLTGMEVLYGPSFRALGGEFGNAILTRGQVVASRVVALPSFGEPRSLLDATVEVRGGRFEMFVTHLAAWGSFNRRIRARQVACLGEHLRQSPRPFVLCGDLNAVPGSTDLAELAKGGFAQLCGLASEPTHSLLGRRLDYIYADPRFQVVDAAVLRDGPSDHWPIAATLAWPEAAR
jgi:endonuclease/exonuclease/phosphatase family metal-dependent hydrolase